MQTVKKHISLIIQYLKLNGIQMCMTSMQSHTKAKLICSWVERHAKHFHYEESMADLKTHEAPYFVNLPVLL